MARAGAAVVLFAAVCCLLVAPAPARLPVELQQQIVHDAVDREAAAEPLLRKPLAVDADMAQPAVREEEVGLARDHDGLVLRCGGDAAVLSSSEKPLSLDGRALPAREGEAEEDMEERPPYDSDSLDSDWDTDSDDEDEDGIVGWLWGLAHLF